MKIITHDDIINALGSLPEDLYEAESILDSGLKSDQPEVYEYLEKNSDLNNPELKILNYAVKMAWGIISRFHRKTTTVSRDFLDEQFSRNYVIYMDAFDKPGFKEEDIREILNVSNNQPHLIEYMLNFIAGSSLDPKAGVRHSSLPFMIIEMKTVIDCFLLDEKKEMAEISDKKFSERTYNTIKNTISLYIKEFTASRNYIDLADKQKKEAVQIISVFGEMMYSYLLMFPRHWNARRTEICVLEIMTVNVTAGNNFFRSIEDVLRAFMIFCAEKDYVPDGKYIARRLLGITEQIMKAPRKKSVWDLGKSFFKKAEGGVDISAIGQMNDIVDEHKGGGSLNRNLQGRNEPCTCGSGKKYKKCCGLDE